MSGADLNWERKLLALKALGGSDTALHIRAEGDWYVRVPRVEMKEGPVLRSLSGDGDAPETAIEDCWKTATSGAEVVVGATSADRRSYRWNGFMWERLP